MTEAKRVILSKLASTQGRNDEGPNIAMAEEIAATGDTQAVKALVEQLHNKSTAIQNDCIKVLYEVGARAPTLIASYSQDFLTLLDHKNNRLQWGAMTALHCVALEVPKTIYGSLPKIIAAADKGSVITKDYAVHILIRLCTVKEYADDAFSALLLQLRKSPVNQLPMYAEKAAAVVTDTNKGAFVRVLTARLDDIDQDSKRKRVEKVVRQVVK